MEELNAANPSPPKRRWWPVLKWSLFVVMLVFVGKRAVALWQANPAIDLHVDVRWLIPAAAMYLLGWFPSVWFWRALLRQMDQHGDRYELIRAYFVGHIGKYVPGKALVLVIRGGLLKQAGLNPLLGALTAAYETLVSMAAGAAIAVALAPAVIPDSLWQRLPVALQSLRQHPWVLLMLVIVGSVASAPLSAWLFTRVGRKALPKVADSPATSQITAKLVIQGLLITSLGWMCHALSLGCTLQSISTERLDFTQFPVWLASVSLSTFAGFVILVAPGGLGVREWVLIETLKDQPAIGSDKAIVAAGLLRIVWFVSELAAGLLYFAKPARRSDSGIARTEL